MFNLIQAITFGPGEAGRARFAATVGAGVAALPGALSALFAPTLPGVYNGGDYLLRLSFADEATAVAALASDGWASARALLADPATVAHVDHAIWRGGRAGGADNGAGLYRVALFCANIRPDGDRLAAFADQTAAMPRHVRTIRRWQLGEATAAGGTRPWTHVWEQEYPDLDGLNGAYMLHPVHWAHVERWFDPEYPEHLVDPQLVHSFCAIDQAVIVTGR